MENILAVKAIPVHIHMYSEKECTIFVEYHNQIIKFQEYRDGLYYYNTANTFISHISYYSF